MSIALDTLLARSIEQRVREYQYRFAQTVIFGLPVIGLHVFGHALGGAESERWSGVLQAILAGWITYVGAMGMLFEGMILLSRRRPTMELLVATTAVGLYGFSAVSVVGVIVRGDLLYRPLMFYVIVILLAGWTGYRWWQLSRA